MHDRSFVASHSHGLLLVTSVFCIAALWYYYSTIKSKKKATTHFDSLATQTNGQTQRSTHFNAFLKEFSPSQIKDLKEVVSEEIIPEDAILVPIIYGTEFGFSKEITETLAAEIRDLQNFWPLVLNMADYPQGLNLQGEQIVIFVCSTQGDGVPPYEAREFCEWLFKHSNVPDLSSTLFSVCALGDRSYTHFCRCGKRIKKSMIARNAIEFTTAAKVDKENWTVVNDWIGRVTKALPLLTLDCTRTDLRGPLKQKKRSSDEDRWTKTRPFMAEVLKRWNLCQCTGIEDKKTVHIDLNIQDSGLTYLPGDAVAIYPQNRPEDIDELLDVMNSNGDMQVSCPSWAPKIQIEERGDSVPLREALLRYYDIRNPKPMLFQLLNDVLSRSSSEPSSNEDLTTVHDSWDSLSQLDEKTKEVIVSDRLKSLIEDKDVRSEYLENRHVADILSEFRSPRLTVEMLLKALRPLQPRQYSISSSCADAPLILSITVAEVKYQALEKSRVGVASTYLTERIEIGDEIPIYITPNPDFRLPPSSSTPILMIGPGTGLAPFRSFVLEKLAYSTDQHIGTNLLFFGCRKRDQDFLYRELLEHWHQKEYIQLHTAFSREQKQKVYVQQRLWECAEEVWGLIQSGGHIYVCGDAKSMASDVEECLLKIIEDYGKLDRQEAMVLLDSLANACRYQRDVWF